MKKLDNLVSAGAREGWSIFWSPVTGMFRQANDMVNSGDPSFGIFANVKSGLKAGWSMYWSPFASLGRAIQSVLAPRVR